MLPTTPFQALANSSSLVLYKNPSLCGGLSINLLSASLPSLRPASPLVSNQNQGVETTRENKFLKE